MTAASERVSFPFHFPAIPLAHHEDMPKSLPPVEITGDTPISFEFVKVAEKNGFRQVTFRWTNHTNKDIHGVTTKVEFLDAGGAVLESKDVPASADRILLEYDQTVENQLLGSSAPEGTASARVTLKTIDFADTTQWSAAD